MTRRLSQRLKKSSDILAIDRRDQRQATRTLVPSIGPRIGQKNKVTRRWAEWR